MVDAVAHHDRISRHCFEVRPSVDDFARIRLSFRYNLRTCYVEADMNFNIYLDDETGAPGQRSLLEESVHAVAISTAKE